MHTLLKLLLVTTLALITSVANAAFVNSTSGVGGKSGSFNETTNLGEVTVQSLDRFDQGYAYSQLEDTFTTAGVFSFDWQLLGNNSSSTAGYLLNGNKIQLAFTNDSITKSTGTTTVTLAAGDAFGWFVESNLFGSAAKGSFSLRNASFTASPSAVPEPALAWLFGSSLLVFAGVRRKQA